MSEAPLDWLHLPADMQAVSLWDCLHDAELASIQSDLLARTLTLEFDIYHLRSFHNLAEDVRFIWRFERVMSVRASSYTIWPGEIPDVSGLATEKQNELVAEYQQKWREQSISWDELENSLMDEEVTFDVVNAELATNASSVALRLQGHLHDAYSELFIRAESCFLVRSDSEQITLHEFIQSGEEYWAAFASRS